MYYCAPVMQIKVLDHLIIGDNTYFSFAADGLIEEYELDYLNLKLRGTSEAKKRLYKAKLSSRRTPE
ncbi:JAB domain-containing protein [Chloroflexota bacterium]